MKALQGDMPFLDTEMPSANGVLTAPGLAKVYGAIANGGRMDGRQFLWRVGLRIDRTTKLFP
jgi:hypothetical protein